MPFGLCNATATIQRLMERAIGEHYLKNCLIYLDGPHASIWTASYVFEFLHDINHTLNSKQCIVFNSEITYLASVVSEYGIKTEPDQNEAKES